MKINLQSNSKAGLFVLLLLVILIRFAYNEGLEEFIRYLIWFSCSIVSFIFIFNIFLFPKKNKLRKVMLTIAMLLLNISMIYLNYPDLLIIFACWIPSFAGYLYKKLN